MATFKETVPLVFAGVTVTGITRVFTVLDRALPKDGVTPDVLNAGLYIPLACAVYSVASSILSHRANVKLAERQPDLPLASAPAMLAWLSAGCIVLMCFLAVSLDTIAEWFSAYAVLCLVNAGWNYRVLPRTERTPHVFINGALAVLILMLVVYQRRFTAPQDLVLLHVALVAIFFITLLKRMFPRFASATS
jgi:hypothetical protein